MKYKTCFSVPCDSGNGARWFIQHATIQLQSHQLHKVDKKGVSAIWAKLKFRTHNKLAHISSRQKKGIIFPCNIP
jgi:hypothetical protein